MKLLNKPKYFLIRTIKNCLSFSLWRAKRDLIRAAVIIALYMGAQAFLPMLTTHVELII
jgi:hypothetical protein